MPARPSWNHQPPKPGTPGYVRVLARGCGGHTDYWGEFDCDHYNWRCDDCPIVLERVNDAPDAKPETVHNT